MLTDATDILQVIQYSPLGLAASDLNETLPKLKLGFLFKDKYQYLFILCKILYSFPLFECTICIVPVMEPFKYFLTTNRKTETFINGFQTSQFITKKVLT